MLAQSLLLEDPPLRASARARAPALHGWTTDSDKPGRQQRKASKHHKCVHEPFHVPHLVTADHAAVNFLGFLERLLGTLVDGECAVCDLQHSLAVWQLTERELAGSATPRVSHIVPFRTPVPI